MKEVSSMMDIEKTRAGLVPVLPSEVPYSITTAMAEDHLQRILNKVSAGARSMGANVPDITITLHTLECSKKFRPLFLMMPTSALAESSKNEKKKNEPSIFNTSNNGEQNAKLHKPLFEAIKPFLYTKGDVEAFTKSPNIRRTLRIDSYAAYNIKNFHMPKVQTFNNGRDEYVVVVIDPIRLFHQMLETDSDPKGGNRGYDVEIGLSENIRQGNFKYEVFKVFTNNGKKKNKNKSDRDKVNMEIQRKFKRGNFNQR